MKNVNILIISFVAITALNSCECQPSLAKSIVKEIEQGTDSILWRRYNSRKQIIETITSYHDAKLKTVIIYDSVQKIAPSSIYSYFIGRKYGHHFKFDSKGSYLQYSYYVGNNDYVSYIRYYNKGALSKELGSILVDEIYDNDKAATTLYYTSVFHDSFKVKVSSPATDTYFLTLKPSSMQPMLLEGSIRFDSDSVYTIVTSARDKERNQFKTYYDTLRMKK